MANDRSSPTSGLLPEPVSARPPARRLMEAAVAAFADRGYHGVSVRDLTSAVGIQGGSFYSHFDTKEQLLFELQHLAHSAHQAAVRDGILSAGPDPRDQLREGIRANVRFQGTFPLLTIVANSDLHALSAANRAKVLAVRHETAVLLAAVVERGNTTGAFDCKHPWLAVYGIGAMGIRLAWWFRPQDLRTESPTSLYPLEASNWLPDGEYTLEQIADEYADYALNIVAAT